MYVLHLLTLRSVGNRKHLRQVCHQGGELTLTSARPAFRQTDEELLGTQYIRKLANLLHMHMLFSYFAEERLTQQEIELAEPSG